MKTLRAFFLILLFSSLLYAQGQTNLQSASNSFVDRESPKYQTSLEKFYKSRSILRTVSPQVLEKEIADSGYVVGPGDQLNIHMFGEMEEEFPVTISPEGTVVIPTVGSVSVAGLDLRSAKKKIRDLVRGSYLKADVKIDLLVMRKFRVYLVGEVEQPGTYFAQASDRLTDIIQVAQGLTDWADETRIQIRHHNGRVDTLNISGFLRFADKKNNPFVQGGDVIYVPPIDLNKPYVLVESHKEKILENKEAQQSVVNKTSTRKIYRLVKGETLPRFLERIASYSAEVDLSRITLIRDGEEQVIDLLGEHDKYKDFTLRHKDLLIIPDLIHEVYVRGEVKKPGAFVYNVNLTANDYIGKAGVLEKAKGSDAVLVVRAKTGEIEKGGDVIIEKGDTIIVPRKNRELLRDYIGIIAPIVSMIISTYSFYLTVTK